MEKDDNLFRNLLFKFSKTRLVRYFKTLSGRIVLSIIYVFIAIISFSLFPSLREIELLDSVITNALSILFISLVVDYYRDQEIKKRAELRVQETKKQQQQRDAEDLSNYKKSLLRSARSRNNNTALDAIDLIREQGWLDGYTDGVKLLEGENLTNADLTDANLSRGHFTGTQFNGKAKLDGVDFSGAYLRNAQFNKAQLSKTIFVSANLVGADFTEAHLYGCVFRASHKEDEKHATLFDKGAHPICFIKARIVGLEESSNEIDNHFSDLRLNGATFKDAYLTNIHFKRTLLIECDFAGVYFKDVSFDEANLEKSRFVIVEDNRPHCTQITSISFQQANLSRVDFRYVSFIGVKFNAANLTEAQCTDASFGSRGENKTDFSNAILHNVIARDAIFDDVIFNGSTIFFDGRKLDDHWSEILEIH